MSRFRPLAALVAMLGLVAGVVAAVAIPRTTQGRPAPVVDRTVMARLPGPVTEVPVAGPAAKPGEGYGSILDVVRGTVQTEVREPDPAGGPAWVVRSFDAEESYPRLTSVRKTAAHSNERTCFQLGRELGGRFGWVDGENVFRPVLTRQNRATPTQCGSRQLSARREMALQLTTLVGHPTQDDRSLLGSVLWGGTGKPLRTLTLDAAGRTQTPRQGPGGGFIALYGPERSPSDVTATSGYADGTEHTRSLFDDSAPRAADLAASPPDLGSLQIIARAPDPAGGPSTGLTGLRTEAGFWCIADNGPIVGDRIGAIDPVLGVLFEQDASYLTTSCGRDQFPPGQVISMGSSFTGDRPGDDLLAPARKALRLQSGRSAMYGIARRDVDFITFASPRDVRTIAPTGPANAYIVVWDGDFAASGSVKITTHLKDGSTRVYTQDLTW